VSPLAEVLASGSFFRGSSTVKSLTPWVRLFALNRLLEWLVNPRNVDHVAAKADRKNVAAGDVNERFCIMLCFGGHSLRAGVQARLKGGRKAELVFDCAGNPVIMQSLIAGA
jgi:hypothetical protein